MRTFERISACFMAFVLAVGTMMPVLMPQAWAEELMPGSVQDEGFATAADDTTSSDASVGATVTTTDGKTTSYATLAEAVAAAPDGSMVTVTEDADLPAQSIGGTSLSLQIDGKSLTLDGNGHTLTVHGRGIYVTGGATEADSTNVVFRNVIITNPDASGRVVSARNGYKTMDFEDVTLKTTGSGNTQVFTVGGNTPQTTSITFVASTIQASAAGYGIITFNPVNLTLDDTTVSGYGAIYMKGPDSSAGSSGSLVKIQDGSVVSSTGLLGSPNDFGTIVFENCDDITVDVESSTIKAEAPTASDTVATSQSAIFFSNANRANGTQSSNDTVNLGEGTTVLTRGAASTFAQGNGAANTIEATAGSYVLDGDDIFTGDDADAVELKVTGGTWNKDVEAYVPDDSETKETSDGTFVVEPKGTGEDSSTDDPDNGEAHDPATHDGSDGTAVHDDDAVKAPTASAGQGKKSASDAGAADTAKADDAKLPATWDPVGTAVALAMLGVLAAMAAISVSLRTREIER